MNKKFFLLFFTLLLMSFSSLFGADKPTVAVVDFQIGEGVDPNAANAIANSISVNIKTSGKYNIVERMQIKRLLSEQSFNLSGLTAQDNAKIGRMTSADYLVTGSINKIRDVDSSIFYLMVQMVDPYTGNIISNVDAKALSLGSLLSQVMDISYELIGSSAPVDTLDSEAAVAPSRTRKFGQLTINATYQNRPIKMDLTIKNMNGKKIKGDVKTLYFDKSFPPGVYEAAVSHPNNLYLKQSKNFEVIADKAIKVDFDLKPNFYVISIPKSRDMNGQSFSSQVYLDDVLIGNTPIDFEVNLDSHKIEVAPEHYAYYSWTTTLNKQSRSSNSTTNLYPEFILKSKEIVFTPSPMLPARLSIDGNFVTELPNVVTLDYGEHSIYAEALDEKGDSYRVRTSLKVDNTTQSELNLRLQKVQPNYSLDYSSEDTGSYSDSLEEDSEVSSPFLDVKLAANVNFPEEITAGFYGDFGLIFPLSELAPIYEHQLILSFAFQYDKYVIEGTPWDFAINALISLRYDYTFTDFGLFLGGGLQAGMSLSSLLAESSDVGPTPDYSAYNGNFSTDSSTEEPITSLSFFKLVPFFEIGYIFPETSLYIFSDIGCSINIPIEEVPFNFPAIPPEIAAGNVRIGLGFFL